MITRLYELSFGYLNLTLYFFYFCLVSLLFFVLITFSNLQSRENLPDYKDSNLSIERRVDDLLKRMTLEEKIAQLQCLLQDIEGTDLITDHGIGGLGCFLRPFRAKEAAEKLNRVQKFMVEKTHLGIPVIMHDEALHGLVGNGATGFPQAIGLAATWDTDLMTKVARAIAIETKSRGIRQVLSPVVNIARDVRWGRVEETYGEDPYLTAQMGVAFCKSFEQEGVITTPKHYSANVGDGGRDSNPVHFSERLLKEIYFPGFKACFLDGGATSVMAAYNSLNGVPCSASKWLLTDVLRNEWGFKGFVVSDYGSVAGIFNMHHTAANEPEAAKQAIEAGLDVELPNIYIYGEPLLLAVKKGMVSESTIDQSVRRILTAKFRLELFENPYANPEYAARVNDCPEHRELALQAAREAIVLLKNANNALPLKKDLQSLAVIGPLANVARPGGYSGWGMKTVSLLEGIKNKLSPATKIYFEKGCELGQATLPAIPSEYLLPPGAGKGETGLKGEYYTNKELAGKPTIVRIDKKIHFDWAEGPPDPAIKPDQFSVRWTGKIIAPISGVCKVSVTTDDGVRLFIDGKLLVDQWGDRGITTDIITFKFEKGRQYDIKMEYYENGGYAFASLGWDITPVDKNILQKAVDTAKQTDAVVVVVGIIEGEGRDRAHLNLPGWQEELINEIVKTGKPTVVVLINGSAVTMANWFHNVPAILEAWYPGEEGGNAIADVLFGDYNPGGKLPITFPQSVAQVPLYYNPKHTGRGYDYVDLSGKPLFPFGHGLGYTKFEYSNLQISPAKIKPGQNVVVKLDVQNIGVPEGDEVVQLYLHDIVGSVSRPIKELKGFKRITLASREKQTVSFELTPEHLSMYDLNLNWVVEPGVFEVLIGSSSDDIRLKSSFEVIR